MKLELTPEDFPPGVFEAAIREAVAAQIGDLQLLTAKEAAKLLALPENTFRELARRERCGSYDLGLRKARWSLKQIRALQGAREVKAISRIKR